MLKKTSTILKKDKKTIKYYEELYKNIVKAFNEMFWKDGKLSTNTQAAYVIALQFDLLEVQRKQQAINSLVQKINDFDDKISTALSVPHIFFMYLHKIIMSI